MEISPADFSPDSRDPVPLPARFSARLAASSVSPIPRAAFLACS